MDPMNIQKMIGWSALVYTAAGVLSFITLMVFFVKGGLWGPANDILSVVWALSFSPLAGWLFLSNRQVSLPLSAAAAVLGIGAALVFAALQFMLVVGMVRYEQTVGAVLALTGVIGLCLIINGLMARTLGAIPPGLILVMLAAGVGLLLSAVGYFLGGEQHPLAAAGYVAGFIAGFVWPVWLARLLFTSSILIFQ